MRRKKRKWDEDHHAEDPATGLLNLFDVWIAFAAALLLASLSYAQTSSRPASLEKSATTPDLQTIERTRQQIAHYRVSEQTAGGDGERLGVAYRLKSGEVIYVPESR
jgi:hypothetical protein